MTSRPPAKPPPDWSDFCPRCGANWRHKAGEVSIGAPEHGRMCPGWPRSGSQVESQEASR